MTRYHTDNKVACVMKDFPKTPQSESAKHLSVRQQSPLDDEDISRIIEMAWEDRTPFEAIEALFGVAEPDVIKLMRSHLRRKTFNNWRARVSGRNTKHDALRSKDVTRGYCATQYKHVRKR